MILTKFIRYLSVVYLDLVNQHFGYITGLLSPAMDSSRQLTSFFHLSSWKPAQKKPKSRLLNIFLPQVGFFHFSGLNSRLWALIKKVRPRFLIYAAKILAFHLVLSFGRFRARAKIFSIHSISTTFCSISTWKIELCQIFLLFRVSTTQGHSGPH